MRIASILAVFFFVGCQDKTPETSQTGGFDTPRLAIPDSNPPDAYIIDWSPPDPPEPDMSREEQCSLLTSNQVEEYCICYPDCCDQQRWYCPPNPLQTIDVMEVVVEVCNEQKEPCIYGTDEDCPPPEILSQSECRTQWECPPGTSGEILEWFQCQLEDGTLGRQQVICDKGNLLHLPCQPCEEELCNGLDDDCDGGLDEGRFPCATACGEGQGFCVNQEIVGCDAPSESEERCNFEDDDCDGNVDEGQRNACDDCGIIPPDVCDGEDNDCDGDIDEDLVRECETPCNRGIETCSEGNWISCTAIQPVDEECDGEDNDCDGQIDEDLECLCTVNDVGNLMPCFEPPLVCGQGFKTCECVDQNCTEMRMTDCAALCSYLPPPQPECDPRVGLALQQEQCNNFDEDCDQTLDEGLIQPCYTGSPETLFVGVCSPGEVYCSQGSWGNDRNGEFEANFCLGEIIPQEEICDGADNDCDGIVDYGEEIRETDILFIVDWSGSMEEEIEAVKVALNRFATHFSAEEPLQWGLVVGPRETIPGDFDSDEYLYLISDISPFQQFLASFAALGSEGMDTGNEMLLDALYLSVRNISPAADVDVAETVWWKNTGSDPVKENFVVNWRPNSHRIVIVFSDEEEQSFLRERENPEGPQRPITKELLEATVQAGINLKVYAFSTGAGIGNAQIFWEDIANASGGSRFLLTSNAMSMYNDLMSIIDEACLPREEEQAALSSIQYHLVLHSEYNYDYINNICF